MKSTSQRLKVGDFVIHFIDTKDKIYRYGTVVETDIYGGLLSDYVKVCWVTTDMWPVSIRNYYEDETREINLCKIESQEEIDRLLI